MSVLVQCIYWEPKFPKMLTKDHIKTLRKNGQLRLIAVSDITCDIDGSIEVTQSISTIDNPMFYYDSINDETHWDPNGPGIMVSAIDHLPAELPRSASEFFG